jgi:hypothetical protein
MDELDLAWGYCFYLPEDARANLMWHSRLDVLAASGVSPGLAFHNTEEGLLFNVNAALGLAELQYLKVNSVAVRVEVFNVARFGFPFVISLEYNALTGECSGAVGDEGIFNRTLPYKSIPVLPAVSSIEIVTITSPDAGGAAEYGNLVLNCE